MVKNMSAISLRIRDMGKGSSSGRMEENMKEDGKEESNTVLEYIATQEAKRKRGNGMMGKESDG